MMQVLLTSVGFMSALAVEYRKSCVTSLLKIFQYSNNCKFFITVACKTLLSWTRNNCSFSGFDFAEYTRTRTQGKLENVSDIKTK